MALSGQVGRIYENGYFSGDRAEARRTSSKREILERKQAESALRHERDRAQRYLDTAEVILLALDLRRADHADQPQRLRRSSDGPSTELLGRDWIETCLPARMRADVRTEVPATADGGDLVDRREPGPHQVRRGTADRVAQPAAARRRRATSSARSAPAPTSPSGTRRSRRCGRRRAHALRAGGGGRRDLGHGLRHRRAPMVRDPRSPVRPAARHIRRNDRRVPRARRIPRIARRCSTTMAAAARIGRRFLAAASIDLARRHGAMAERRGPHPSRRARRTGARRRHFAGRHRAPQRSRSSISRRRRWKRSAGWPAASRTTSTIC